MSPQLTLNKTELKHVENYKYLGMFIDNSLTFRKHIRYLKALCSREINLLKLLSNITWGADRKSLLRLYIALLKPKLDYGCEVYGSACTILLKSLQPFQIF